ncbi:MAG: hypothetical protein PVF83_10670 [Anaerolineales bacterium]|jgi:hypothetical protein
MLDRKQNLNKLIQILKLVKARKAMRIEPSKITNQADQQAPAPVETPRPGQALRSHLTDTDALARKIRAEMVRDAQAAFAAVMTELNASQTSGTVHEVDSSKIITEESDEPAADRRLIHAGRVGEA